MAVGGADQNQNSLNDIIGIFGDLGSKLNLLTKGKPDEPLNVAMKNFEDIEKTISKLFQNEDKPNGDHIEMTEGVRFTSESSIMERFQERSEMREEIGVSTVASFGNFVSSSVGDENFKLTYLDLIFLLLFVLGVFFIFFVFMVMVCYCWKKMFGVKERWRDLSESESDSSVSWVSINTTTTTEDTPVKPPSQPQDVSTVRTVLQTDIIAPICEQKILMVPGEFVLDRGTQWCRTEISPSIIV